jgi:hypothetical protein
MVEKYTHKNQKCVNYYMVYSTYNYTYTNHY